MTHACRCGCRTVNAGQTLAEVVAEGPGGLELLKEKGINHCCGAQLTLEEAAASAGVSLDTLLAALAEARKAGS
jgi:iron-sulfur cluster repair protein YtfE (RIC family)